VEASNKKADLPRNIDALIGLIEERDETIEKRDEVIEARDETITTLLHNLSVYARMLFGGSSEKRKLTGLASGHPHQLHLFLADLVADAERIAEETGVCGNVEVERPDPRKQVRKKGRRTSFLNICRW